MLELRTTYFFWKVGSRRDASVADKVSSPDKVRVVTDEKEDGPGLILGCSEAAGKILELTSLDARVLTNRGTRAIGGDTVDTDLIRGKLYCHSARKV